MRVRAVDGFVHRFFSSSLHVVHVRVPIVGVELNRVSVLEAPPSYEPMSVSRASLRAFPSTPGLHHFERCQDGDADGDAGQSQRFLLDGDLNERYA